MAYILLVNAPDPASQQARFEHAASQLNLNPGLFAFSENGRKYLNSHIQWLWSQYLRGVKGL